ncbi:hypothetical protein AJ79_00732 [Helicocarpus griseus UAMH5409]|uniref:Uncharacterized protein n=1 Tax=Helicocarpus griseus UAMH5409 TaxID=1447875 RepID=A0A2B7Y1Z7_9EURO|nr:hypothetical protein AJ79_00732 [Helicocarpus griseus UAMH5409]
MLSRLKNAIAPTGPRNPSALIAVTSEHSITVLHLVPEDGTIEQWGFGNTSPTTPFRYSGAREQTREQIGVVALQIKDGDGPIAFLNDVATKVRQLWDDSPSLNPTLRTGTTEAIQQLIQDVLQPAAVDAIRKRGEQDHAVNAAGTHSILIIRITRSRSGRILTDKRYTSFR